MLRSISPSTPPQDIFISNAQSTLSRLPPLSSRAKKHYKQTYDFIRTTPKLMGVVQTFSYNPDPHGRLFKEALAFFVEDFLSHIEHLQNQSADTDKPLTQEQIFKYQKTFYKILNSLTEQAITNRDQTKPDTVSTRATTNPQNFFINTGNLADLLYHCADLIQGMYINPQAHVIGPIGSDQAKVKGFKALALTTIDFDELIRHTRDRNTKEALRFLKSKPHLQELLRDFVRISKDNAKGQVALEEAVKSFASEWVHPHRPSRAIARLTQEQRRQALVDALQAIIDKHFSTITYGEHFDDIQTNAFDHPDTFFSDFSNVGVLLKFATDYLQSTSVNTLETAKDRAARAAKAFKANANQAFQKTTLEVEDGLDEHTKAAVNFLIKQDHLETAIGQFIKASKSGNSTDQQEVNLAVRKALQGFVDSEDYNANNPEHYQQGLVEALKYIATKKHPHTDSAPGPDLLSEVQDDPQTFFSNPENTARVLGLFKDTAQKLKITKDNKVVTQFQGKSAAVNELVNTLAEFLPGDGRYTKIGALVGTFLGEGVGHVTGIFAPDLSSNVTLTIAGCILIVFVLIGVIIDLTRRGTVTQKQEDAAYDLLAAGA